MGCANTKHSRDSRGSLHVLEQGGIGQSKPDTKVSTRSDPRTPTHTIKQGADQYADAVLPPPRAADAESDVSETSRTPETVSPHARNEGALHNPSLQGYTLIGGAPEPWAGTPLPIDPSLPVGWEKIGSSTGNAVYIDHVHGTHTASIPDVEHVTFPSDGRWEQRIAAGSHIFFVDHTAKTTQWTVPSEFGHAHRAPAMDLAHSTNSDMLAAHVKAHRRSAQHHETAISTMRASLHNQIHNTSGVHGEHDTSIAPEHSELPTHHAVDHDDLAVNMHEVHHGIARFVKEHQAKLVRDFRTEARQEVAEIIRCVKSRGELYEDPDFVPPADVPEKMWLRPNMLRYDGTSAFIKAGTKFSLFNKPVPADAKQGTIGDCWLISSLGLLAGYQNGRLLSDVFPGQTNYDPSMGAVVVRLCIGGRYHNVLIDDQLPCLSGGAWNDSNRCLSFALSSRHQLWSPFVEKAYAKCCRGYLSLISGSATEALTLLTGSPTVTHNINCPEAKIPAVWASLKRATKLDSLMVISTVETSELGLVPNHAYALWGILEITVGGVSVKLFRIHNPHGHGVWTGRWSDKSAEWTEEARAQVGNAVGSEDGTFYMELADVRTHFDEIVVCGVHPEWVEHRLPVAFPNQYHHQHVGFEIYVAEESSMVLSLTQPPQRILEEGDNLTDLSFVVLSIGDTATEVHPEGSRYFDSAPISLKGSTLLEREFPKGRYLIIPFSFWNKREGGIVKDCTLVVQSESTTVAVLEHEVSLGQYRVAVREFIVGGCQATPSLGHVKQSKTLPMTTYYRADGHGIIVWEENNHQSEVLRYDLHFEVFNGMWCSRETQNMSDALPPLHGKLVAVALSVGITEDHDAQYTWKYTWGSFTKNKAYQLHLDDLDDIHCPITGPYDVSLGITQTQAGPTFVQQEALRHATTATLPIDYNSEHPSIVITVREKCDCHIAMLPGPNAAERPELRTADQDAVAVDLSFVLLDADGRAIVSAPLNVMGSAVAGHALDPGTYTVVPFNHSNKKIDGDHMFHHAVHIEMVTFTTKPVSVSTQMLDLLAYKTALREYIVSHGGVKRLDNDPITKFTRHDGHGSLIWVDNLSPDKTVFHAMQFQLDDGIAVNRMVRGRAGKHYEDIVPPNSGKLVMVAWSSLATGESVSQANTLSHSNGWKAAKSFERYCSAHNVQLETTPIFQAIPSKSHWAREHV